MRSAVGVQATSNTVFEVTRSDSVRIYGVNNVELGNSEAGLGTQENLPAKATVATEPIAKAINTIVNKT